MTSKAVGKIFEFLGHKKSEKVSLNIEMFVGNDVDFFDESSDQNSPPIAADLSNTNGTRSFSNAYFADTSPDMPDPIIATDFLAYILNFLVDAI